MPWDALLDLLDGVGDLADAMDLAEAGIDVSDLIEAIDLGDCDPDLFDTLGSLAIDDPFDVLAALDDADVAADATRIIADLPDGETLELFVPTAADFPELLDAACHGVDPSLLDGLHVTGFDGGGGGLGDGVLGSYDPALGQIVVDTAHPDAWATLHHEIGHHLIAHDATLVDRLAPILQAEGFTADQHAFLGGYLPHERPEEVCAEALGRFRFNPFAFAARYPQAAALFEQLLRPA